MPPTQPKPLFSGDTFRDLSDFFAGWSDKLTFGLTASVRGGFGYDDAVDKTSGAYGAGQMVGGIHQMLLAGSALGAMSQSSNAAVSLLGNLGQLGLTGLGAYSGYEKFKDGDIIGGLLALGGTAVGLGAMRGVQICNLRGWQRVGAEALRYGTGAAAILVGAQGITQMLNGDATGGLMNILDGASNLFMVSRLKACFVAGTPILVPGGSKRVEDVTVGDEVLSRNEWDAQGPVRAKRVLQTFVRVSPVLNLHVRGRIIGTTGEHPFFVEGKGWVQAGALRIGDVLVSHDGQRVEVEGVADSGRVETVYNFEVEDDHTYFVGDESWGFSVWAHNAEYDVVSRGNGWYRIVNRFTRVEVIGPRGRALAVRGKANALTRARQEQANDMRIAEHTRMDRLAQEMAADGASPQVIGRWRAGARQRIDDRQNQFQNGEPLAAEPGRWYPGDGNWQ